MAPQLAGLTFFLHGELYKDVPWIYRDEPLTKEVLVRIIESEGGAVLTELGPDVNYLLQLGHCYKDSISNRSDKLNRNEGASIQRVELKAFFHEMLFPSRPEYIDMLKDGERGIARFATLVEFGPAAVLDLRGVDMRGLYLAGVSLKVPYSQIQGVDFSGSNMAGAQMKSARELTFDDCDLQGTTLGRMADSSFVGANLTGGSGGFIRCNLEGANLTEFGMDYCESCTFRDATLVGMKWRTRMQPERHDFGGANLAGAWFRMVNFNGSSFRGADLSGATVVSEIGLKDTDFRDAVCRDAHFGYVDLDGAQIAGADFTGATVRMANLTGVDIDSAVGLREALVVPRGKIGDEVLGLEKLAAESSRISFSGRARKDDWRIEFELHYDQRVARRPPIFGEWSLYDSDEEDAEPILIHIMPGVAAENYTRYLMDIAGYWTDAEVDWKKFKVQSSKSPIKGRELKDTVIAALKEAWGEG